MKCCRLTTVNNHLTVSLDRATSFKMDKDSAKYLVSVIGIGNTIGRVALGFVSSLPQVDALLVNNVFITISGLLVAFSGLSFSVGYQYFYAASFGLSVCKYILKIRNTDI